MRYRDGLTRPPADDRTRTLTPSDSPSRRATTRAVAVVGGVLGAWLRLAAWAAATFAYVAPYMRLGGALDPRVRWALEATVMAALATGIVHGRAVLGRAGTPAVARRVAIAALRDRGIPVGVVVAVAVLAVDRLVVPDGVAVIVAGALAYAGGFDVACGVTPAGQGIGIGTGIGDDGGTASPDDLADVRPSVGDRRRGRRGAPDAETTAWTPPWERYGP